MKLSKPTLVLLKNFCDINPQMRFLPGQEISVLSAKKDCYAKATIAETIPARFAVYNLSELLDILSLFNEAEIECGEHALTVKSENQTLTYYYTSEEMITAPPEGKTMVLQGTITHSLTLSENDLNSLKKAAATLNLDVIGISAKGVRTFNGKTSSSTSNVYSLDIPVTTSTEAEMRIDIKNLKLAPGSYKVEIDSNKLVCFTNEETPSLYYIIPALAA